MPHRPGWGSLGARIGEQLGLYTRLARAQSRRLRELARAAQTQEGRQRDLIPLIAVVGASGLLLGLALGLSRKRRR